MIIGKRFLKRLRAFIAKPLVVVQTKAIVLDERELCNNPIFLVGVHRSGTSLVRRMFNSHPNIACPPETFFLRKYCELYKDELTYPGFRGFGWTREDMRLHIARQASELHEAFRMAHGKTRWADKTPQHTECLEELCQLFGAGARFVLIFRDPRDVAFSIYERKWRFNETDASNNGMDLLDDTIQYVSCRMRLMINFQKRHPDRTTNLSYENVVQHPQVELGRALKFLGEKFSEAMLTFNSGQHNLGVEDPIVRGTSQLRLSGGYWKNISVDERVRIETRLGPLAEELGYTV